MAARRRLIRLKTIALLTGIPRGTLSTWRHRGAIPDRGGQPFPTPDETIDDVDHWWWPDVGAQIGVLDPPTPAQALTDHLNHINS